MACSIVQIRIKLLQCFSASVEYSTSVFLSAYLSTLCLSQRGFNEGMVDCVIADIRFTGYLTRWLHQWSSNEARGPKGPIECQPVIPSPLTSYKDVEPQTGVSP